MPSWSKADHTIQFVIHGVSGDILKNAEARLNIEKKNLEENASEARVRAFFNTTPKIISEALTPYGYFHPHINSRLDYNKNIWVAVYVIDPGYPVRFEKMDVQIVGMGSENKKLQQFIHDFPIKVGDIFIATAYNEAKKKMLSIANSQGYVEATFDQDKIVINTQSLSAILELHLNTKELYYFGPLLFNNNPFDPEFLQRFKLFDQNEPFSSEKLINYQQEMNDSRYFDNVNVFPDFKQAENYRIPIHISVFPPKARKYSLGLGYGSFTGPRLTAGINFNRITNTGQSVDAQLKLSSVLTGVALRYYIPGKNPLTDQWVFGLNHQKFKPKNGDSMSISAMAGYIKKIKPWQIMTNINYLYERYTVENAPSENSELLYPSLNITYVKADNLIKPHFGRSLNFTMQGASRYLISSTSFLQGQLRGKYFFTPLSFAHIILRADFGYTVVNDLSDLPLSMRFFAGGINSIRGYPSSSLGPGRYLGVASIEYQNHISENWAGAIFYDIGTATNQFGSPLNKGAGIGIIYESVVGPIRLYLAQAISKPGKPYQVEFSLGPEF